MPEHFPHDDWFNTENDTGYAEQICGAEKAGVLLSVGFDILLLTQAGGCEIRRSIEDQARGS